MIKVCKYTFFAFLIFIVGCTDKSTTSYNENDIVAIVRGEEITLKNYGFYIPMKKHWICYKAL